MRKGARAWLPLLCLLLGCGRQVAGQGKSLPVSNTTAFADALADQTVTEIILDPGGTGVSPQLSPCSSRSARAGRVCSCPCIVNIMDHYMCVWRR